MKFFCFILFAVTLFACSKSGKDIDSPGGKKPDVKKITMYDVVNTDTFTRISYSIIDTNIANAITIDILDSNLRKGARKTYFFNSDSSRVDRIHSDVTLNYPTTFCEYNLCYDFAFTYNNNRLLPDYVFDKIYLDAQEFDLPYGISGNSFFLGPWDEFYDYSFGGSNQTTFEIFIEKDSCSFWRQDNEAKYDNYFYDNIPGLPRGLHDVHVNYLYDQSPTHRIKSCVIQLGYYMYVQNVQTFFPMAERKFDFTYDNNSDQLESIMGLVNPVSCLQTEAVSQFQCFSFPYTPQDFYENVCSNYTDSLFTLYNADRVMVSTIKYINNFTRDGNGMVVNEKRSSSLEPNYFRYLIFQ